MTKSQITVRSSLSLLNLLKQYVEQTGTSKTDYEEGKLKDELKKLRRDLKQYANSIAKIKGVENSLEETEEC